ncbi:hypothetical protein, partial [Ciceribacter ferrooxidans]|uniref:hypothetical protein n=1 Tax=Ciceribacter ferrooxidans TaxID=2509717 RepID=UPI00196B4A1A
RELTHKVAQHGLKLEIPGLQPQGQRQIKDLDGSSPDKGLLRVLTEICNLELNGNLHSELEVTLTKESEQLRDDSLLNGLLASSDLKVCLDTVLEN